MGMIFNSIPSAEVTISGAVATSPAYPVMSATQTAVGGYYSGTGSSATVYTVPAGKVLYLYGIIMRSGSGALTANLYETDGTTIRCQMGSDGTTNGKQFDCSSPMIVLTAGQFLKFNVAASAQIFWYGVLESV